MCWLQFHTVILKSLPDGAFPVLMILTRPFYGVICKSNYWILSFNLSYTDLW